VKDILLRSNSQQFAGVSTNDALWVEDRVKNYGVAGAD
jgi:hypothetical protein